MGRGRKVGFVTMGEAGAAARIRSIGIGMLGYAFMGKAHSNAYKKITYMTWPPPLAPRLVSICGRNEKALAGTLSPLRSTAPRARSRSTWSASTNSKCTSPARGQGERHRGFAPCSSPRLPTRSGSTGGLTATSSDGRTPWFTRPITCSPALPRTATCGHTEPPLKMVTGRPRSATPSCARRSAGGVRSSGIGEGGEVRRNIPRRTRPAGIRWCWAPEARARPQVRVRCPRRRRPIASTSCDE